MNRGRERRMNIDEWKGVWVLAEQRSGRIDSVSFELIQKAKELKMQLKSSEPVTAVIIGNGIEKLTEELGEYGAEEVIVIDDPALEMFNNEIYSLILTDLIKKRKPEILLIGATISGQDIASMLGVRLGTGVATHSVGLHIDEDNNLVSAVPAFGGKVIGDIICPKHRPQIATVKPGILEKGQKMQGNKFKTIRYDPSDIIKKDKGCIKALAVHKKEYKGIPLQEAKVVVAGGFGIGSKGNWNLLRKLAQLLGGTVGCSRPVVDEGWIPDDHCMIGTSGKTIRPKLYIGFGISGSTHHVCGMKDSDVIISINKDENAPIFNVSDVGVVGDAEIILKDLIEKIEKLKSM
ncbi:MULTISPECIES: electron transfer flavoprotein subunit alpha/FixB family protein [Tissierellales]|uniref:Electron transfer flavoprotein subunit alpha/FixB family protein n=1 Tax=Acidilutibacter cellobiosedens TaxID=2507161 RepID=A0A410QB31_9FIRM|nr:MULTISPECIES: electron transfer flavoprotein subunit alpha/FixB family protein [Tissierellales]QAT61078.1 electron transfer flavoprotein subunit alpha/FixB family protein [Acidilutibacter cellobiosedens]